MLKLISTAGAGLVELLGFAAKPEFVDFHIGDKVTFEHEGEDMTGVIHVFLVDQKSVGAVAIVERMDDADLDLADRLFAMPVEFLSYHTLNNYRETRSALRAAAF